MTERQLSEIRSFIINIYDQGLTLRCHFILPLSVIAPIGNRIFIEAIPEKRKTITEPWFYVMPHSRLETGFQRTTLPYGPTSLCGGRYFPEKEPLPRVSLYPEALVTNFSFFIKDFNEIVFQGFYTTDDFFLAGAEFLTRKWIEKGKISMQDGPFYYSVDVSSDDIRTIPEDLFPPEAYQVEGVFHLPALAANRKRLTFRKIPPKVFPVKNPSDYVNVKTMGRGQPGTGKVVIHAAVYRELAEEIELSRDVEVGGFLVGLPFRQPESPESEDDPEYRWIIEITDLVKAEGAWGKPLALLFTGDTWSHIRKHIDINFPDKELVSWFHTHLFKASDSFGLSGMDQELHKRFLTRPWQVAILVNIDIDGNREVRCFQKGKGNDLVECTFEVF